jgi:23S rRNA (uracil1939-C5)-methyltransferase
MSVKDIFNAMQVKIEKAGINGEGIGYIDRKPVFIDGVLPYEIAEIRITETNEKYMKGELLRLVKPSPFRVEAPCPVQHECGGCALMIANVPHQEKLKLDNLKQSLIKYMGDVDFRLIKPLVSNPVPLGYRNMLKLPVKSEKGKLVSGLYSTNTNHFVKADHCLIHSDPLERVKTAVLACLDEHHEEAFSFESMNGIRYLILRGFESQFQLTLVVGNNVLSDEVIHDLMKVPGIASVYLSVNTDRHSHDPFGPILIHKAGLKTIPVFLNGVQYELSPTAFFQLNTVQASALFTKIVNLVKIEDVVLDAYCGVGAMSLLMAKKAKKVIGLEINKESVKAAIENAEINKIINVDFSCGDVQKVLPLVLKTEKISVLVMDPPRSGLSAPMIDTLLNSNIPHLIYVSCNPSTLAKNMAELKKKYEIVSLTPFDLFTQSPLLEVVADLRLIKSV